jgi:1-acyl-sn-glycerol-3-phosphate acyltransferase
MDWIDGAGRLLDAFAKANEGLADLTASPAMLARIDQVKTKLGPEGVDPFGFDPAYVRQLIGFGSWLYHRYFRCQTFGISNLPAGRCLLVANHSGQLPYDGMMIGLSGFFEGEPPRAVRSMVDRFVPNTPFVSPTLARLGQVLGTPNNCRHLLGDEQAILVFPEGQAGLNKLWNQRYRLQRFGHGFMRLALEMQAPIVPVAVIGAEEQAPSFYNMRALGRMVGMPALPLTLAPFFGALPLPTRYRIHYGTPMHFTGDGNEEEPVIGQKVREVKMRLQAMVNEGVAAREHIFW